MLVLSRKPSEQIMIGPDIRLTVVKVDRNQVRIGIEAPSGVAILREELAGKPRSAGPAATYAERDGRPASEDERGIEPR